MKRIRKPNTYCAVCGAFFHARAVQVRQGGGKFCSHKCHGVSMIGRQMAPEVVARVTAKRTASFKAGKWSHAEGPKHPNWKGGVTHNQGYRVLSSRVTKGDAPTRYEHRAAMSRYLGRVLLPGEVVHHINHDKTDNRIENLQVLTIAEHLREHRRIKALIRNVNAP